MLARNRTDRICIYKGEIHFMKFTHLTVEAGKSKICRIGQQARDSGSANVAVQVRRLSSDKLPSRPEEASLLFFSDLQLIV